MKIICIEMNYRDHLREIEAAEPTEPVFFLKPDTALLRNNDPFFIPDFSQDVQYECELVVHINRVFKSIEPRFAHRCYDSIGLGIDFTARDLQHKCRTNGMPWEISKAFDKSAVISPRFLPVNEVENVNNLQFELKLNNETRQIGLTADMIFSIDQIISYVSQFMTLKMGDLIYTGTPAGVGTVAIGDHITATLQGETLLDFDIK